MAQLTTARKLGIAGRVLGASARRSRLVIAAGRGARAAWGATGAVLRRLWHEVTGFFFLCFAAIGAWAGLREYRTHGADARVAAAAAFAALFVWFGVSSMWRASKIKSKGTDG